MNSLKNFEEIDRYISNALSASEKKAFELRIHNDPELKREVDDYQDIKVAIKHRDTLKFVETTMNDLDSGNHGQVRKIANSPYIRVAAIFVLLLGITLVIVLLVNENDTQTLANYFEPNPINYQFRGDINTVEEILSNGSRLFNDKHYAAASDQFKIVIDQDQGHIQAAYFLGLSYLYSGEFSESEPLLLKVVASGDMNYSNEAKWYMCWCYLNTQRKASAFDLLNDLKSNKHYRNKAESVLRIIEKE